MLAERGGLGDKPAPDHGDEFFPTLIPIPISA